MYKERALISMARMRMNAIEEGKEKALNVETITYLIFFLFNIYIYANTLYNFHVL